MSDTILFVCGSLEPGRDGVGDHARVLAHALARQGRPTALIAWRDPHVRRADWTGGPAPQLRLPAGMDPSSHADAAIRFSRSVAPAWISLHYVPYAFDPRGFPLNLPAHLRTIAPAARLHLMVHEPWSDGGRGGRLRRRIFESVHRAVFRYIHWRLAPALSTTTNRRYADLLLRAGVAAETLPLFSNITVEAAVPGAVAAQCRRLGAQAPEPRNAWIVVGLFGSWHAGFDPLPVLLDLANHATRVGARILFVAIGGIGDHGQRQFAATAAALSGRASCVNLGRLPDALLSPVLQDLDVGISSTPADLIGKSSAVAALLEHGVPVVAMGSAPADTLPPGVHVLGSCPGMVWDGVLAARPRVGGTLAAHAARYTQLLPQAT